MLNSLQIITVHCDRETNSTKLPQQHNTSSMSHRDYDAQMRYGDEIWTAIDDDTMVNGATDVTQ